MSENLAVARRWVELYNDRGDVTELLSLLDPEVVAALALASLVWVNGTSNWRPPGFA